MIGAITAPAAAAMAKVFRSKMIVGSETCRPKTSHTGGTNSAIAKNSITISRINFDLRCSFKKELRPIGGSEKSKSSPKAAGRGNAGRGFFGAGAPLVLAIFGTGFGDGFALPLSIFARGFSAGFVGGFA